jgi:hypothetical protein
VLDQLRGHPAWVKIVIAGTNKLGGVSGVSALERADDATIYAERTPDARYTLRFTKRRWQPCATAVARSKVQLERGTAEAPPVSRVATGCVVRRPDFRIEALREAAAWPEHDLGAYVAHLRADGVPQETLEDWQALVGYFERGPADVPEAEVLDSAHEEQEDEHGDGPLPASLEAPYAALLQSWPWTEPVRVATILEVWHNDEGQFPELFRALRRLTDTAEEVVPTAHKIGNVLRWLRGHPSHGMTLAYEMDRRKRIAHWRVVRAI